MTMNISNGQPCVSICCKQDMVHHPGAKCYWNVSLTTVKNIFPKILPLLTPRKELQKMIPGHKIPCPNNTVCYSDCNSENNISTYLFGSSMIPMNYTIDGGLTCRLDDREYCFQSHVTDTTENVTSICEKLFDLEATQKFGWAILDYNRQFIIYPMSISCFFLVATFLIYTLIPELKNLHGLILRTYMSCCFGCFLGLMLNLTYRTISCSIFLMIPLHFVSVAAFLWLNVMSFDIWWTFRTLRDSSKQSPGRKYIIYSIYAWGIPTLIIGVGLIIEFIPNVPKEIIKPGLQEGCWISGPFPVAVYILLPLVITLGCDICFFVLACISITRQKKAATQCFEESDSRRFNDEKSRFYLYLKLFIVTGLTWISEAPPLYVTWPPYVGRILHFINHMQGLIIFILFVCNDRTSRLLSKRLGLKDRTVIQWIQHAAARIRTLVRRPQAA